MAVSSPVRLDIAPGIVRGQGPASTAGRFTDADKVRFHAGRAEKIGGWTKAISTAFVGLARGMLGWTAANGTDIVSFGTAFKAYAATDAYDNITPTRETGTLTDPFSTTNLSAVVAVADTGHGLDAGAYVTYSGATAVGGITISGEYTVTSVTDANNYTITHSSAATSTAGPGGGSVDYEYEINPGNEGTSLGLGFGAGPYGEEEYGTPRTGTSGITFELRRWFFARYGTHLMVLPSGGGLYKWDQPNAAARAVIVSGAPTQSRAMFVTAERFPFLLGTIEASTGILNPMHVRWPDVDAITDWTPGTTDRAGARTLQAGNRLIAGTVFSSINLIWSDTALYLAQYIGGDFIYDIRVIATGCGLISADAYEVTPQGVFWMSGEKCFLYNGTVQQVPRFEEVIHALFPAEKPHGQDYSVNREQADKIACGFNRKGNDVWWLYPAADATENDRYVAVSLEDFSWTLGTLVRTAITFNDRPAGDVVMAGTDSYLYLHEIGKNADGAALEAWIETDIISLGDGATDMDIEGFVPVFERQEGDLTLTLTVKDRPMSTSDLEEEDFTIEEGDDLVDCYLGGRYAKMRLTSNVADGDFRLGIPLIEVGPAGGSR